jgi:nitroimidazol reductase NimA-like FMN-containing flavoprotein (pyridoxamine 5'-phosphate oxidase superfamily)
MRGQKCVAKSVKRTAAESAGMIMRDRNYDGGLGLAQPANNSQMLSHAQAMRLLASVDYGRVVFTQKALPAVRPVNHVVDEGRIIIRTRLTTAISTVVASADGGVVVAYEADDFDSQGQSGWSVVATGWAHRVNDPGQVSRYERVLHAWVNHADTVLAIEPHIVTGFHIIASKR